MKKEDKEAIEHARFLSKGYDNIKFAYSLNEEWKEKYEQIKSDKNILIVFFRKFDDGNKMLEIDNLNNLELLENFINSFRIP